MRLAVRLRFSEVLWEVVGIDGPQLEAVILGVGKMVSLSLLSPARFK
jgi:hypothetical protein